ncbi:MAG TPA: alpha-2-macroglobulin family protein, partial [Acidobacteriota bacterium]|nr:alpha-2-macroglobulin family protein [Acidobacteriota bacterium]
VEARIDADAGFFLSLPGASCAFSVLRTDLNGTPKAGQGAWRVVRLTGPETTLLPADQPLAVGPGPADPAYPPTPGDLLRPRWSGADSPEEILHFWEEGRETARGRSEHDAKGMAKIEVKAPQPGAYRLIYETKDDFGASCRESFDFLVGGPERPALKLPLVLKAEKPVIPVGGTVRFYVGSGWAGQPLFVEKFSGGSREIWLREAGKTDGLIEIRADEASRGGFGVRVTAVRDHQLMTAEASVYVPWDDKELGISFATFRDKLTPGARETWRVTVKTPKGTPAEKGAAELLAYMYDRSLDLFAPHNPPRLSWLYPDRTGTVAWQAGLGEAQTLFAFDQDWHNLPGYPAFRPDELASLGGYGIGGPGGRRYAGVVGGVVGGVLGGVVAEAQAPMPAMARQASMDKATSVGGKGKEEARAGQEPAAGQAAAEIRSNFAETAFWEPNLLTGADGTATIEFTVPDSVTSWRVFVHGVTRDLAGGTLEAETKTVKDLMARPYLPRFFREGDKADLRVMVNNAGAASLAGEVTLEITDPLTGENLAPAFGLPAAVPARAFKVEAGGGTTVVFPLAAPARVGTVAFKVVAKSGALSDGELRPLPVL